MSERMDLVGGNKGVAFDDGVFDGVKKIIVGEDKNNGCLSYIKIEYEKDGKFETREHGKIRGELKEYEVEYPNEYIISVGGSYDDVGGSYDTVMIKSLIFRTSRGKTSEILGTKTFFGYPAGKEFRIEGQTGGKLLGIHGRSGDALNAIGATFYAVSPPIKHFNRQGGDGGGAWDDGAYDGVRKLLVGRGDKYVSYVQFEYAKREGTITHDHGTKQDVPEEFVVDYPNEHITLVEGTIDDYLTSLKFKTSKGRTSPAFGNVVGRKFVLEENDFRLVGFCGRSGKYIDALGANFGPLPPTKMGPLGGTKGNIFDDGVFDGVKKITVGVDEYSVTYIKIEYEKDGKEETREHGTAHGELKEFSVDYPKENIIAVGGSYNYIYDYETTLVTSLYFTFSSGTNSEGFTSPLFGEVKGTEFELKGENGGKLIGFHGRGGSAIDAIGAYFKASSGGSQKVEPKGGSGAPISSSSSST